MAIDPLERFAPMGALRDRTGTGALPVRPVELFFDLVYVFSIIQLSHYLLHHPSWAGAVEALTLFAAIWWAWTYSAWSANWIEPAHPAGRVLFLGLMALAFLMAISVETAFSDRAWLFVLAYVAMAWIRAGYLALIHRGTAMATNYAQLGVWGGVSGLFWLAGAAVPAYRLQAWAVAVLIDYAGPYAGYWVPGMGRTAMKSWTLEGRHLLERHQLVILIALGESILLLGQSLVAAPLTAGLLAMGLIGFLTIVALWWIYFLRDADKADQVFASNAGHTARARTGLTYGHGIMVGGAIAVAVALEEILAHPLASAGGFLTVLGVAGPLGFLAGNALFLRALAQPVPVAQWLGAGLLALAAWQIHQQSGPALALGLAILAALVLVAALSGGGREQSAVF
ncbi:MAG: low temperature requirement protein A [Marinibacterium sp.]